jgi:CRISPR/Cas system CMR-associated protein Cmr5 small subunit
MASIKGTGLSGYVQRSRVAVRQTINARGSAEEEVDAADYVTPLEAARGAQENHVLASLLAQHDRLRELKMRVLDHKEMRLKQGADLETVNEECHLMGESLLAQFREENAVSERERQTKAKARGAQAFAEAFAVESAGSAFDRAKREEDKASREVARRAAAEQKLLDRAKKVRLE